MIIIIFFILLLLFKLTSLSKRNHIVKKKIPWVSQLDADREVASDERRDSWRPERWAKVKSCVRCSRW